jgi:hypothetical protein
MFRHHPDGIIYIGDLALSLADFLLDEPAYALPAGMIARDYVTGVKHTLSDGSSQHAGPLPWSAGAGYLARIEVYRARANPPPPVLTAQQLAQQQRDALQAQIDAAERKEMMPRMTRETLLALAVKEAAITYGLTEPQLYLANIGYRKLKDFEIGIVALRDQMVAIA